jgi:hypothetical protein
MLVKEKAMQTVLVMVKDFEDTPRLSAKERATRRWRNHDVEKRFKEEKAKPLPTPEKPIEPEIAGVISRDKPDGRGSVIRAQTKFAKYIRDMLDDHKHETERRNQIIYGLSIRARRCRLLKEKLRRLEARQKLRDSWEQPNV